MKSRFTDSPIDLEALSVEPSVRAPVFSQLRRLPSANQTAGGRPDDQPGVDVLSALPGGLHEVIVVDGLSTDDTVAVTRRLWPDVRIVMQTGRVCAE
jgi:hypothetical protein